LLSSQIAQISFLNPIVNGTQQTGLFPAGDLLASGELVPVPEPSAWILLAISAGLLFAARRKRRLSRLV
jgi:hypothetical protein